MNILIYLYIIITFILGIIFISITFFEQFNFWCIFWGMILIIASFFTTSYKFYEVGYKKGQVNAISKYKIEYELIEKKDGTKTWIKKELK